MKKATVRQTVSEKNMLMLHWYKEENEGNRNIENYAYMVWHLISKFQFFLSFVFCWIVRSLHAVKVVLVVECGVPYTMGTWVSLPLSLSLSLFSSDCVRILCKKSTNTYHSRERENRKIGRVSATHGSFFPVYYYQALRWYGIWYDTVSWLLGAST